MSVKECWMPWIIFAWVLFALTASSEYVVFGISRVSAFVVIGCVAGALFFFQKYRLLFSETKKDLSKVSFFSLASFVSILVLDALVGMDIFYVRTDAALQTPWTGPVTIAAFFFYGIATALLGWSAMRAYSPLWWVACTLHFFVFYGVALLAFRYGFGYDPLIHQAAELYIADHGRITPLQPYYIGQYAIVTALHFLTSVPIVFIDRFLVPLLTAFTIPFVAYHGLTKGYGLRKDHARVAVLLFLLLPLSELTFTVPYNLSIVYGIWWVFLFPLAGREKGYRMLLCFIALAALVTHALVGVILVSGTILGLIYQRLGVKSRMIKIVCLIAGVCLVGGAVVAIFGIHRMRAGESFFVPFMPGGMEFFFSLFSLPLFPRFSSSALTSLYWYEYWIKVLLPLLAIGLWAVRYIRSNIPISFPLGSIAAGILLSLFLLPSFIVIPGVLGSEQYEFILRLRDMLPWIAFVLLLHLFGTRFFVRRSARAGIILASAVFIPMSLYLAYPQVNALRSQVGWNASKYDIEAVRAIDSDARDLPYAVLSTQLFAVIGLRELGFDSTYITLDGKKFHTYPIAPDEFLFPYATQALHYGFSQEILDSIKSRTELARLYIAIPDSWSRLHTLHAEIMGLGGEKIGGIPSFHIYRFSF